MQNRNNTQRLITVAMIGVFIVIMVLPLYNLFLKAFQDGDGNFIWFGNYVKYFTTPALRQSVYNTLLVSAMTAVIGTLSGFGYAYSLTRTNIRFKSFYKYVAMLPIFMPTVVHGIGLIYLFGRQGVITRLGFSFELYGQIGIIISEIIFTFPQAFLMFYVTLSFGDGSLYETADSIGCSSIRRFLKITLPEVKYTLISSLSICFTLAFTDFGAPKVLGGSYNVLATDIYKQIAGQFNFNMGAVVGTLLLIPAVISFAADRILNMVNRSFISSKAINIKIKENKLRDVVFSILCLLVALSFIVLIAALLMGSLVKYYPYNLRLTLEHFGFNNSSGGLQSFLDSVYMSILTAAFGTIFVFIFSYILEKGKGLGLLKKLGRMLSAIPIALPGIVIGISFIFFFNSKTNPLNFIYNTFGILVIANILHFYSVPYITATGALKKLDKEYESVAESLKIPSWKVFLHVTVPLSLTAVLEIFMYYFVNSMVTVSAVVFLYSSNFKIASIAITHMEEAGDIANASAMGIMIIIINLLVRSGYEFCAGIVKRRHENSLRL